MKIERIKARQILDSRGEPTVEADVMLDDGTFGRERFPPVLRLVLMKPMSFETAAKRFAVRAY